MDKAKAKLGCELFDATDRSPNGEDTEAIVTMQGTTNDLCNALHQLSVHLLSEFSERYGKAEALGLYLSVQTKVIESIEVGVEVVTATEEDLEKKVSELHAKRQQEKRRNALLSILGKTFKAPGKDGAE